MLIFCYKKLKDCEKNFNLFNEGEEEAPLQLFNTSVVSNTSVDAIETMNQGGGNTDTYSHHQIIMSNFH
ncbi:hypothetical protein C5167_020242 [Papaver somniferum]|uniref:Uncharacterized protein n=1 Tax=Papaver somniferum TaxID=3469 RepID=A0A4Y7IWD7_PAPSO|nr:hypothetical protein C5167_020242 [Papaver somniferum]